MDFGTLLNVAQRNETAKQSVACYQTKFAPPKKQTKQSKTLSENIKKFLARKEEEEKQKALEEKKKKENLLSLRDHKAQSRINKHLKVCKSANKAVLADAVDNENTAVTIAGPSQPDEDDYGYVSQEASALYNQLMNKYNSLPPEKPLFSNSGKKTAKDIASTKDRVKQALKQQEIEEASGHRRKRKLSAVNGKTEDEKEDAEKVPKESEKEEKPKLKRKPLPPPMDFTALLKLAEKKQHEPVVIETKPKNPEPERLMTKKQMKEYMKEKEWRERKEQREKNPDNKINESKKSSNDSKQNDANKSGKPLAMKIPKTNGHISTNTVPSKTSKPTTSSSSSSSSKKVSEKPVEKSVTDRNNSSKISARDELLEERKKLEAEKKKLEELRKAIEETERKLEQCKSRQEELKPQAKPSTNKSITKPKVADKMSVPVKDAKPKQFPPSDIKPKQFPPADVKPRQFPPPDVRRSVNDRPKQFPPADLRPLKSKPGVGKDNRKVHSNKRRIYDDDDEEYDSELDDFIDDGPEEECEDYSKYISEIFGYDKTKYRHLDDEDDAAMESNFAQQLKEEFVSTKIGIMEDLEDIRKEAMEKKRKAMVKKKTKK